MLKIEVVSIGRDKAAWIREGCNQYLKLLSGYAKVSLDLIPAPRLSPALSVDEVRAAEGVLLRKRLDGYTIALHEQAPQYTSEKFARLLERLQTASGGKITMLIGGAHGLDRNLLKEVDSQLSLSALTFPHELTRVILLEQLYRAFSILHNTRYHK
jgi:23S rRNA (pseudouridine1915-N3)-methyltransferase